MQQQVCMYVVCVFDGWMKLARAEQMHQAYNYIYVYLLITVLHIFFILIIVFLYNL